MEEATPSQSSASTSTTAINGDLGLATAAAVATAESHESTTTPITMTPTIARTPSLADSPNLATGSPLGSPLVDDKPLAPSNPEDLARLKRKYVLTEMVETERDYIKDLTAVVEGYIANLDAMELPEDLRGKDKIIFANIQQICDFHKTTFSKEIDKCLDNYEAVNAFVKHERRLHTYYVKYCQNKPKSDFLVSQENFEQFFADTKAKLGHKVTLNDLLIKPVQRIMKYQLMLKDVLKYTEKAHDKADVVIKALEVMTAVPLACNAFMQVGRLQNFEGNLNAQGRLIHQGTLLISDGPPNQPFKGKDRQIFLFEQSAIIADYIMPKKEFGNPNYIFKNQIMVNKMVLDANVADEPLRFVLKSNDPLTPAVFTAQAASMEARDEWLAKLGVQLDQQKTFLNALVDPKKYQSQLASMSIDERKTSQSGPPGSTLPNAAASSNSAPTSASPSAAGGGPHRQGSASSTKSSSKVFGFVSALRSIR